MTKFGPWSVSGMILVWREMMHLATVGADPELAIMQGRNFCQARMFVERVDGHTYEPWGQVGRDGAHDGPLEIRPKPSFKPPEVVGNLGNLLAAAQTLIGPVSTLFVGSRAPAIGGIGGHLHAWGRKQTRDNLHNAHNRCRICVGLSLLWSLEDYEQGCQRRHHGYGGVNDIRRGEPTYEFRSPSSDWLASPTLANACLYYFQALVDGIGKYGQDIDDVDRILEQSEIYWKADLSRASREKYHSSVVN